MSSDPRTPRHPADAERVIAALGLAPHPEGGHYRETWRGPAGPDGRATGTAVYYLLKSSEESRWHRIDAVEVWHFYAGEPLELSIAEDGRVRRHILGPDLSVGARPQLVVPAGAWQMARPLGGWVLVGCTVTPGFDFAKFEIAPEGWSPIGR